MTTENLKIFNEEIMIDELDFISGAREDLNKIFPVKHFVPIVSMPKDININFEVPKTKYTNYKAHEDVVKKIPQTTIVPIPMIPITQPIAPPKI